MALCSIARTSFTSDLLLFRWKNPKAAPGCTYCPTGVEKIANCITHLPWIPFSVMGALRLISKAKTQSEMTVASIYGIALVLLFSASSAFHCSSLFPPCRLHGRLHIMDRLVIHLFIASSYTPWLALRQYDPGVGHWMLFFVWFIAVLGALYQYKYHERCKVLELIIYLSVGLLPATAMFWMMDPSGQHVALQGGLFYLFGIIFFKMDGRIPLAHAIWHCFVASGAYTHFVAVDTYLLT
ncbi:hypothetical protein AAHC03_022847 [Spirometra sp. Aus1]